ncbi:MAG: hypothetical protein KIT18_16770, partial [Burkholderiales bacterium]|nr:hypothetical protein [Burkholderiales bacterium]
MASELLKRGFTIRLPADFRNRLSALRAARGLLAGFAAAVLAALLGFLYFKTQGVDIKRQHEVLGLFRELKEIDGRWDVEVLRARLETGSPPAMLVDHGAALARIQRGLAAAAQDLRSPVLERGLPDLDKAFTEKAGLMAKFRSANTAAKQALQQVMAAENEIAGLVRGTWQDFPQRERLVALENLVVQ